MEIGIGFWLMAFVIIGSISMYFKSRYGKEEEDGDSEI